VLRAESVGVDARVGVSAGGWHGADEGRRSSRRLPADLGETFRAKSGVGVGREHVRAPLGRNDLSQGFAAAVGRDPSAERRRGRSAPEPRTEDERQAARHERHSDARESHGGSLAARGGRKADGRRTNEDGRMLGPRTAGRWMHGGRMNGRMNDGTHACARAGESPAAQTG
jgi:hypothetical protein